MITSPSRRRFVELLAAGAVGTAAGMPLLWAPREARGQDKYPRRLIVVVSYNGTVPDAWKPVATLPELKLGRIHEPLERHKNDILLVNGLRNRAGSDSKYAGCGTHCAYANILTGRPNIGEGGAGGVSVDQYIAQQVSKLNRFRSVEAKLRPSNMHASVSAAGPGLGKEANGNPSTQFDRLFGELRLSVEERDRLRLQRKSVLDKNATRTEALTGKLVGRDATYKLNAYHQAIREIELSLDARTNPGCAVPVLGSTSTLNVDDSKNVPIMVKSHIDMLVAALTCDLTRVYTWELFDSGHGNLFPADFIPDFPVYGGKPRIDGHAVAHDSAGPSREAKIVFERWQTEQFATLLDRLKQIKEGDGTLFDHCVIAHVQAMAFGNHSANPLPAVLSGRAAGWKLGRFVSVGPTEVKPSAEYPINQNDLLISLAQGMGLDVKTFGEPAYCKGPIQELMG